MVWYDLIMLLQIIICCGVRGVREYVDKIFFLKYNIIKNINKNIILKKDTTVEK